MYQKTTFGTPLLRELAATRKVGSLIARGVTGGFILVMRDGDREQTLATQRGGERVFKKLDSLATYLAELGIYRVTVELENWSAE
ncbi:hypothetical protein AB4Z46_31370 [Variovorax sp. M-6]|uniref:hypothetical protein n=1 Tax=Variovorax sp. M-6 TaxID=3233041 RepID=UPI003F960C1A